MGLFGRKARGRHALGAAVTSIPSGPLPSVVMPGSVAPPVTFVASAAPVEALAASSCPPAAVEQDLVALAPRVAPALLAEISALLATGEAWAGNEVAGAAPARSLGSAEVAPQAVSAAGAHSPLRVQLGFRDGTSTSLDPASDQSQALQELARTLTSRD